EFGKGTSKIGVYRRKKINGRTQMAPNDSVPVNDDLTVIRLKTYRGSEKAIFIHFTCHPTTTDDNVISSEFIGVCCEKLEKIIPDCTVIFLQGFCGDVRPALIRGGQFY